MLRFIVDSSPQTNTRISSSGRKYGAQSRGGKLNVLDVWTPDVVYELARWK